LIVLLIATTNQQFPAPMTYTFNQLIKQGETHTIAFQFMKSIRPLRNIESGATKIYVPRMVEALPDNFKLSFDLGYGRVADLVVTEPVAIGDDEIIIAPYTGRTILAGTRSPTTPRVLADTTWRGQVRAAYESPTPLLTYTFNLVGGADGLIQGEIAANATAAAAPNAIFSDIPDDRQNQEAFAPNVWANAYFWDWESVSTVDGTVKRELQGRTWVTREATK
jgi:hypothetical protein